MAAKKTESEVPTELPGRNDPCHCGSGKKYKKCCEEKDAAKLRALTNKEWEKAEKEFEKQKKEAEKEASEGQSAPGTTPNVHSKPPMSAGNTTKHTTMTTPKFNMPRKTGGGGA